MGPQDKFMEVFKNGKSIGIINLPSELFDTKTPLFLAFNVYPSTQLYLNAGQKPFKFEPTNNSLSFRQFAYEPLIKIRSTDE
jgi:hypothetical protein